MRRKISLPFILMAIASAQDFPSATLSNGQIEVKLYTPDPVNGSYQGTRFDWAGIIPSLRYKGHEYFGRWYERHDPKIHDAITGPVEEFTTGNNSALGYDTASEHDNRFIRIGAGVLRKPPGESSFRRFGTYEIADAGKRTTKKTADSIEFTHELKGPGGYAYTYRKTVRLSKGKPELILEHSIRNTGTQPIDTSVYDHNFFVIDDEVVGPDIEVKFPFEPKNVADLKGIAEIKGKTLGYTRNLEKGESVQSELNGFGPTPKDYDFRIENKKTGAGVRITGNRPIEKINYWCIRTVACPEPYIHMNIAPGKESTWRITYDFYTLAK